MAFVRDPCGIVCVVITYGAVMYADYVVLRWIILQTMEASIWAPVHAIMFNTIIFLLCMSHLKAVLSDPGRIPLPANRIDFSDLHTTGKNDNGGVSEWTVCTRCETYRPPRAHHCRICKRCIRRMDHHCPWINNCVGERNQKFFFNFFSMSAYSAFILFQWWPTVLYILARIAMYLHWKRKQECKSFTVLFCFWNLLYLVFFVLAIMVDQMHAILHDETAVEAVQMKGKSALRPNRRKIHLFAEVFGRGHPLCWLIPCTSFNSSLRYYDTPLLMSYDV